MPALLTPRGDDLRSSDTTADLRGVSVSSDRITTTVDVTGKGATVTTNNDRARTINRSSDLGPLHISKMGGSITIDEAPDGGSIHTGGGDIVVERSGGNLTATTGGGDRG